MSSITQARAELDRALADLDQLRTYDPGLVGLVAHALSNYLTVTSATVEMLQLTLRGYPDGDVAMWIEGIGHAADMMQHTVGRLVSASSPRDFPLRLDYVNLPVLVERAAQYYQRGADSSCVPIVCQTVGMVPPVWGDRVAVAVVVSNLLSNAVRVSRPHGTVQIQVMAEPGHVVCSVRDSGPGLTAEEQARLFLGPLPDVIPAASATPSGYGLVVAHEFVKRMDGDLWCESAQGSGARFSFRLPAVE